MILSTILKIVRNLCCNRTLFGTTSFYLKYRQGSSGEAAFLSTKNRLGVDMAVLAGYIHKLVLALSLVTFLNLLG